MKIIEKLKIQAKKLKTELTALYYASQSPETGMMPKLIILFTLGYALSPIDLIPDFIPVIGYLDDLILLPLLMILSIKLIPDSVMTESRKKAEKEPLVLKKNWFFALFFITIWVSILVALLSIFRGQYV